ncbi:MAG: hypothetical protein MUF32_03340 [Burkholderiaceae bacterium]|jgi:hypothetical protein|nr:hypothetical protein [Burkholderiaceae bacterium]
MHQNVIVSFGKDSEFDYKLTPEDLAGYSGDQARRWFDRQFQELECDVPSPMGKVLAVDRILSVAKYAGERRFHDDDGWAQQFARNAAAMMGREVIRVDVDKYSIEY